ncbi:MAG: Gametolysin peptidase M11 family [uncultured bacterium]|nr:MAG: Gametolysin peptidase M11 family [uncultured bacterium]
MSDYFNLNNGVEEAKGIIAKLKKVKFNKKLLILIILVVIGIPTTVILSQQKQVVEKQASIVNPSTVSELSSLVMTKGKLDLRVDKAGKSTTSEGRQVGVAVTKAKERKEKMLKLAEENPEEFLLNALPSQVTKNLSLQVRDQVEKEVDIKGKLVVIHYDDIKNKKDKFEYRVQVFDNNQKMVKSYDLYSAKPLRYLQTGTEVSVKGYGLDNKVVIQGGGEVDTTGLHVYDSPKQNPLGPQKVLAILFNFDDDLRKPISKDEARKILFSDDAQSIKSYYKTNSYDKVQVEGDVVGYYTLPSSNESCDGSYVWGTAAQAIAYDRGIKLSDYNRILYIFPTKGNCWASAWATIGGVPSEAWMTEVKTVGIYAHELGHNFGSAHANSLSCGDKPIGEFEYGYPNGCTSNEYGDPADVMGYTPWEHMFHFNAPHKEETNYLADSQILTVDTDSTVTVNALENVDSSVKAIRVPISESGSYYYISLRKAIDYDQNLPTGITDGVGIHLWRRYNQFNNSSGSTQLIDNTTEAEGSVDFRNSSLTDGKSFIDTQNGISVKQISHDQDKATVEIKIDKSVCRHLSPDLSVSPLSQVGIQGEELAYDFTVKNNDSPNCGASDFSVNGYAAVGGFQTSSPAMSIGPGETKIIQVKIKSSNNDPIGVYKVTGELRSQYPRHSRDTQVAYIVFGSLAYVVANPDRIDTSLGSEPSIILATAMDTNYKRILGGVNYEWKFISDDQVGTIENVNTSTNKFTPNRPGNGGITVKATFNNYSSSFEIPVNVSGTLTPTPTKKTLKLEPTADAFVGKDKPSANHGSLNYFQTDSTPSTISYLKFDLSSLAGKKILKAILRIKVSDSSDATQSLNEVSSSSWTESRINFKNKPSFGNKIVSFKANKANKIVMLDIEKIVNLKKGRVFTLGIDSAGSNTAKFYSRESALSNRPQLVIEYQ